MSVRLSRAAGQKRIKNLIWGLKCGTKNFKQHVGRETFNVLFLVSNFGLFFKVLPLPPKFLVPFFLSAGLKINFKKTHRIFERKINPTLSNLLLCPNFVYCQKFNLKVTRLSWMNWWKILTDRAFLLCYIQEIKNF